MTVEPEYFVDIITAVVSVLPYLADMGEHTTRYKINRDVYINSIMPEKG